MKRFVLFSFLLGALFAAGFLLRGKKELPVEASRFHSTPFALKNHPFAIVITAFNNGASVAKTLASVFSQNYENYRIIYVDDDSDDGSAALAQDLIDNRDRMIQAAFLRNEKRVGRLASIFKAVQLCSDEEIVLVLHGEDWLAHEWVLQKLNGYYANPDLWLTYSQYREFPTYQLGACHELSENVRVDFSESRLQTFYAHLFKRIRESDLVFQGKFFPVCAELAYMIPMLEMAKDHFHFIPEILSIRKPSAKEDGGLQAHCEKIIRALTPYEPLVPSCGE